MVTDHERALYYAETGRLPDDEDDWPPTSLEEAEEWRQDVISEVQGIQAQLGSHGIRGDGSGYRMSLPEFEEWRRKAKDALRHKNSELRKINAWLKENRRYHHVVADRPYEEMSEGELAAAIEAMTLELVQRVRDACRD